MDTAEQPKTNRVSRLQSALLSGTRQLSRLRIPNKLNHEYHQQAKPIYLLQLATVDTQQRRITSTGAGAASSIVLNLITQTKKDEIN